MSQLIICGVCYVLAIALTRIFLFRSKAFKGGEFWDLCVIESMLLYVIATVSALCYATEGYAWAFRLSQIAGVMGTLVLMAVIIGWPSELSAKYQKE